MSRSNYKKLPQDESPGQSQSLHHSNNASSLNSHLGVWSDSHLVPAGGMKTSASKRTYQSYAFNNILDDEEETVELTQFSQRGNQLAYNSTANSGQQIKATVVEIPLQKGDSLQSLAIKFRCAISELKRVNGLVNEQEFFGLTSIKIPVRSHQLYLKDAAEEIAKERLEVPVPPAEHHSGASVVSTSDDDESDSELLRLIAPREQVKEPFGSLSQDSTKEDKKKYNKFISRKDKDLEVFLDKVKTQSETLGELSTAIRSSPTLVLPITQRRKCWTFYPTPWCILGIVVMTVLIVVIIVLLHHIQSPPVTTTSPSHQPS